MYFLIWNLYIISLRVNVFLLKTAICSRWLFGILIINFMVVGYRLCLYKIDSCSTWYCLLRKGWGLLGKICHNFKGPSTFVTFNNIKAWFLKKNVSLIVFYWLTKFHCLMAFTLWNIGQYVYCKCLLTRLWPHKFWT